MKMVLLVACSESTQKRRNDPHVVLCLQFFISSTSFVCRLVRLPARPHGEHSFDIFCRRPLLTRVHTSVRWQPQTQTHLRMSEDETSMVTTPTTRMRTSSWSNARLLRPRPHRTTRTCPARSLRLFPLARDQPLKDLMC